MKKIIGILLICFPICLNAQQNSLEINGGGLIKQTRKLNGVFSSTEIKEGYFVGIAFKQSIFDEMSIKYGLRSTPITQSIKSSTENFSATIKGRWDELFATAHHDIWKKGLYLEYGVLVSFLNKVDTIIVTDFTIKTAHRHRFNMKQKIYFTAGIGYQYIIKEVWQPFIQFDLQATKEKIIPSLVFESTNPYEFRSSVTLGCRFIIPKKTNKIE